MFKSAWRRCAANPMNETIHPYPIRWGILSTAQIARKNWKAIFHTGNARVAAVASREAGRSRRFIADCQREVGFAPEPEAMGSYEELIASPNIDAVYIPLPTGIRKEWVLRAAKAGKHVLCEKPCGRNAADVREMIEACRSRGVQFMDGVMFMHGRRLGRLRAILDDGLSVGPVKRVTSSFCGRMGEDRLRTDIRGQSDLEPLGCLGDLGWYCIRFSLWAMNWQMPREVTARMLSSSGGTGGAAPVPTEMTAELLFDGGRSAGLYCSFVSGSEQWANVSGPEGALHVPDFVVPFKGAELTFETLQVSGTSTGCDVSLEPRRRRFAVEEHSHGHPTAQETHMFRTFSECVHSGRLDDCWPRMALQTQQVLDACLEAAHTGGARPVKS